ncbi:hypothetical protein SDJN03_26933, partial [Cucurbita argyrosperma subsp. sororia]
MLKKVALYLTYHLMQKTKEAIKKLRYSLAGEDGSADFQCLCATEQEEEVIEETRRISYISTKQLPNLKAHFLPNYHKGTMERNRIFRVVRGAQRGWLGGKVYDHSLEYRNQSFFR